MRDLEILFKILELLEHLDDFDRRRILESILVFYSKPPAQIKGE